MGGGTLWTVSTNIAAGKQIDNYIENYVFLAQGLNFLFPVIDNIKYVQSLKEVAIDIPSQSAITEGIEFNR